VREGEPGGGPRRRTGRGPRTRPVFRSSRTPVPAVSRQPEDRDDREDRELPRLGRATANHRALLLPPRVAVRGGEETAGNGAPLESGGGPGPPGPPGPTPCPKGSERTGRTGNRPAGPGGPRRSLPARRGRWRSRWVWSAEQGGPRARGIRRPAKRGPWTGGPVHAPAEWGTGKGANPAVPARVPPPPRPITIHENS
jgi:hypothetical protein